MDVEIKLQGFVELAEALKGLPDNINKNALRAAVGAGAAVVRNEAKRRAPVATGVLRRAMYSKQIRELSSLTRQVVYVGARQGKKYQKIGKKQRSQDAFYARFIEFGHYTRPAGGGRLKRGRGRNAALLAGIQSGAVRWVPPQPFLRPAFDAKKQAAIDAMAEKIRERLDRFRARGR